MDPKTLIEKAAEAAFKTCERNYVVSSWEGQRVESKRRWRGIARAILCLALDEVADAVQNDGMDQGCIHAGVIRSLSSQIKETR